MSHFQGPLPANLLLRQLYERESCTFTYLLADKTTKHAVLIDPVDLTAERDLSQIDDLGLTLTAAFNTHMHADHITGTALLKTARPAVKSIISRASTADADVHLDDGDITPFGEGSPFGLKAISTPGHTVGCLSYALTENGEVVSGGAVFTGDTVLIRGCGRTDFQGGSAADLFDAVHSKIFSFDPSTALYPGHDYKGRSVSTVGEELAHNLRLNKPKEEFIELMANLGLAHPKKIDVAVPANKVDGFVDKLEAAEEK